MDPTGRQHAAGFIGFAIGGPLSDGLTGWIAAPLLFIGALVRPAAGDRHDDPRGAVDRAADVLRARIPRVTTYDEEYDEPGVTPKEARGLLRRLLRRSVGVRATTSAAGVANRHADGQLPDRRRGAHGSRADHEDAPQKKPAKTQTTLSLDRVGRRPVHAAAAGPAEAQAIRRSGAPRPTTAWPRRSPACSQQFNGRRRRSPAAPAARPSPATRSSSARASRSRRSPQLQQQHRLRGGHRRACGCSRRSPASRRSASRCPTPTGRWSRLGRRAADPATARATTTRW